MADRQTGKTLGQQVKEIAEAMMLQAIEDIWLPGKKRESPEFFGGNGFTDCADIIGMSLYERQRVLQLVQQACRSVLQISRITGRPFKVGYLFFPQPPRIKN
jgi:hypothetical protein